MSDKKRLDEMTVYELLNDRGQMDKIIDLFAEATDDELLPIHRQYIKNNIKDIASKLDKMIVILRDVNDDPEKKRTLIRELERRQHKMPVAEDKEE